MKKILQVSPEVFKVRYVSPLIRHRPMKFEEGDIWHDASSGTTYYFKQYDNDGMELWEFEE